MPDPGFPLEPGHSVTYITGNGFQTGYFVRWNKNGAAVIKKPAGGHVTMQPRVLRPVNDGRMMALRGWVDWPTNDPAPAATATAATKRKARRK